MESLQTLTTVVNLRLSEEVCEIIPNIKKLHLVYDPEIQGYDDSLVECLSNLDRLHKLESLYLEINPKYRAPGLHPKLAFPLSLNKLCMSGTCLSWEDLSVVIGSLPRLQVLRLNTCAVTEGKVWSPISGQFPRLEFLRIQNCNLYTWDAECSHFPVLKELVLRGLYFLEEIPLEIGEIPTLGLVRVERCSESTAISAVKIKKDQLQNQYNHALQIEVEVFDTELESLKKSLEAEELALCLFKLEICLT